jgi:hypothetical protein
LATRFSVKRRPRANPGDDVTLMGNMPRFDKPESHLG